MSSSLSEQILCYTNMTYIWLATISIGIKQKRNVTSVENNIITNQKINQSSCFMLPHSSVQLLCNDSSNTVLLNLIALSCRLRNINSVSVTLHRTLMVERYTRSCQIYRCKQHGESFKCQQKSFNCIQMNNETLCKYLITHAVVALKFQHVFCSFRALRQKNHNHSTCLPTFSVQVSFPSRLVIREKQTAIFTSVN